MPNVCAYHCLNLRTYLFVDVLPGMHFQFQFGGELLFAYGHFNIEQNLCYKYGRIENLRVYIL